MAAMVLLARPNPVSSEQRDSNNRALNPDDATIQPSTEINPLCFSVSRLIPKYRMPPPALSGM